MFYLYYLIHLILTIENKFWQRAMLNQDSDNNFANNDETSHWYYIIACNNSSLGIYHCHTKSQWKVYQLIHYYYYYLTQWELRSSLRALPAMLPASFADDTLAKIPTWMLAKTGCFSSSVIPWWRFVVDYSA